MKQNKTTFYDIVLDRKCKDLDELVRNEEEPENLDEVIDNNNIHQPYDYYADQQIEDIELGYNIQEEENHIIEMLDAIPKEDFNKLFNCVPECLQGK